MGERVNHIRLPDLMSRYVAHVAARKSYKTLMIARRACQLFYEYLSLQGSASILPAR